MQRNVNATFTCGKDGSEDMTHQEQSIADDKMRAEIARLISETAKISAETAEIQQNMKYRFWVLMAAYVSARCVLFEFV